MLAFTDIDADEDIDGITLLCVLHRSVCRMNGLARNNNGDNTPPDHDCDWGRESCRARLAKTPIIGA